MVWCDMPECQIHAEFANPNMPFFSFSFFFLPGAAHIEMLEANTGIPPLHTGEEAAAGAPANSSPLHPSSTRNPEARRSRQHSSPNAPSHATNNFLHCLRSAPVKVIWRLRFQAELIYRYCLIFHYGHIYIYFIHRYSICTMKCETWIRRL